jgi:hypothetical protein
MKYMMIIAQSDHDLARRSTAEAPAYWAAWGAYVKAMRESGLFLEGHGLQEKTTATTVRMKNGKRIVQDGPFADAKEQLGGYFILESPSIDAVLEWAARVPGLEDGSAVEIRPILVMAAEG